MSDKVPFFVRLKERCEEVDSLLCVGLDPRPSQLPSNTASAAEEWCKAIIDATAPFVAAFKPNAAFFEAWGAPGFKALQNVSTLPVMANQFPQASRESAELLMRRSSSTCQTTSQYFWT